MKNNCSKQVRILSILTAAVGVVLVLWPAAGYSQRSSRRQSRPSTVSVDPNATEPQGSWASFDIILKRNIFSRQRTPARQRQEVPETRHVVTRNPESYYVLKGVVQENDDFIAFIEDTQSGTVLRLHRGDPVARGAIKTLTLDGLEYQMEDKTFVVRLGLDLEGGHGVLTTRQMLDLASMPASSTSGQTTENSPETADILKRLMEQRRQQMGQ